MTTQQVTDRKEKVAVQRNGWLRLAAKTAVISVLAVLAVQVLALAIWPEAALFRPLNSYPRSALFTLVPAIGATMVFSWLVKHQANPEKKFIVLSAVLLLLSFIPDYALALENKTLLASTIAAFLHLTAAVTTVTSILMGYRKNVE